MSRRTVHARTLVRTGIAAVFATLVVLAAVLPAQAGGASPSISSFSPTSGLVGTGVTIDGANFTGTTTVKFNATVAAGFSVNGAGTQIMVNVPGGATTGPISVTTPNGTAISGSNFTVTTVAPTITSFNPTSGPVGTSVTINGTNFGGTTLVRFHNTTAPGFVVNGSGTQITVSVPGGATTGTIKVTNPSGTATSATDFTVISAGAPVITSFNPTHGVVGTAVTIFGSHFTGVSQVQFNGKTATIGSSSDTQIATTVPSNATTGKITVKTPSGTATSPSNFVVDTVATPVITSLHPTSGLVGKAVTILGSGFTGTTSVKFNGTSVSSFVVVTSGKITTTVPSGATTGFVTVTNPAGTATSPVMFTVIGPKITSFSPTSGNPGTTVSILGSDFTGVTSVTFNGAAATFHFVSNTKVTAVVPNGATTGKITLTTHDGTATSATNFTVFGIHTRTVSLFLSGRRLFASGQVVVNDGYGACRTFVPVVIKRFRFGTWKWVLTVSTRQDGGFRAPLPDRPGLYRAKAKRITLANGAVCGGDLSNVVHHR